MGYLVLVFYNSFLCGDFEQNEKDQDKQYQRSDDHE